MSELVFQNEQLNKVLEGSFLSKQETYKIFSESEKNPNEIFGLAAILRNKNQGKKVSFSKKSFFNIINLCRDTCTYCTYKAKPGEDKMTMMSKDDVVQLAKLAKKFHCVEALFVTGEKPEEAYPEAKNWLKNNGFTTTAEYLIHCSELAINEGLFPHTNAGNLTKNEMAELKKTNVSLGLMLENVSKRLTEKGMPHYSAPSKNPEERLQVLENAGSLGIPITTGLLVGIGETANEIIDSLFALKQINEKYGNIQEIIIQNFQPKEDTFMKNHPSPAENFFKLIVAIARTIMPSMNIQIPPNLSPKSYHSFLSVGINDWGGISPLTPDYVNPEFSWPEIKKIEENCIKSGFELKARFPVYPEFFHMVNSDLREKMSEIKNSENFVREDYWR